MSEPFLGEIKLISFNFPPRGWAFCNGQLLPISQNQALFSLLGTTYGGDGRTTFALPNLQGRTPIHEGNSHVLGEEGGQTTCTLLSNQMPAHIHLLQASLSSGNNEQPEGCLLAAISIYQRPDGNATTMSAAALSFRGGGQPHPNMQPFLALNFVIALQGIYPSRN